MSVPAFGLPRSFSSQPNSRGLGITSLSHLSPPPAVIFQPLLPNTQTPRKCSGVFRVAKTGVSLTPHCGYPSLVGTSLHEDHV